MGSPNLGPMQGFVDTFRSPINRVQNWLKPLAKVTGNDSEDDKKKQDTSWHDQKVREANDSFKQAAQQKQSAGKRMMQKRSQ